MLLAVVAGSFAAVPTAGAQVDTPAPGQTQQAPSALPFKPAPPAAAPPLLAPEPAPGQSVQPAAAVPPATPPPPPPPAVVSERPVPQMPDDAGPGTTAGPSRAPPVTAGAEKRWYGWQLLISDATFLTLGFLSREGPGAVSASVGLTLGAPVLHFANGNRVVGGFASLGLRLSLLSIATALGATWRVGSAAPPCHDDACKKDPGEALLPLVGVAAGLLFLALDDLVLARISQSVDQGGPPVSARPVRGRMIAPMLAPTPGGAAMALVGTF